MLIDVHLYGALGSQFGKNFRFAVESVGEVIAALRANFPAFSEAIRHGFYRVVLGKSKTHGLALTEEQAARVKLAGRPVHIIPTVAGRKRGLGKIVAGIALIGLSIVGGGIPLMGMSLVEGGMTFGAMMGNFGLAMALTGVAMMIAPEQGAGDDKKSFTMSGPQSNLREGNIVPIAYGEVVTGGYMISGGIEINGPATTDTTPGNVSVKDKVLSLVTTTFGGSARKIGSGRKSEA